MQALVLAQPRHPDAYETVTEQFKGNLNLPPGDDLVTEEFLANMKSVKGLEKGAAALAKELDLDPADPEILASTGEFLLEGLYVNNRLSKYNKLGKTFFRRTGRRASSVLAN